MAGASIAAPSTRSGAKLVLAGAAAFVLLISVLGALATQEMSTGSRSRLPVAIADIPTNYLALYEREGLRFGVDWAVLAAIGKVECDHGRSQAAGMQPTGNDERGRRNGADAVPRLDVASRHAADDSASARPDCPRTEPDTRPTGMATASPNVWNPADAIAGAARLLRANGAPANYRAAIFAYNHSSSYVDEVLAQAAKYRGAFAPGATGGALRALAWACRHVGRFSGYSQGPTTDRGGSVPGHAESRARWGHVRLLDVRALGDGAGGNRHRPDDGSAVACERTAARHGHSGIDAARRTRRWVRTRRPAGTGPPTSSSSATVPATPATSRYGSATG